MPPLNREEFPSINPVILEFDDTNDLLDYIFDQTIGASAPEIRVIERDLLETLDNACKLLRKERQLARFVRSCGRICIEGVINYDSSDYAAVKEFAIVDRTIPTSTDEFDTVIRHFAPHVTTFEELYGPVLLPAKKTTQKKTARPQKEHPTIELPEDYALIDRKVLSSLTGSEDLSPAAKAILRLATGRSGVRFEELKDNAALKKLYKSNTEQLKKDFPGVRDEIIEFLQKKGINAAWLTFGKARATRYLVAHAAEHGLKEQSAAPIQITKPEPQPVISTREVDLIQAPGIVEPVYDIEQFAATVQPKMVTKVGGMPDGKMTARELAKWLERIYRLTRTESRDVINHTLSTGALFRAGTVDGRLIISAEEVEVSKNKQTNGKETKEKEDISFSEDEIKLARKVFDCYIQSGYWDKKFSAKTICNKLGIDDAALRPVLVKLEGHGQLKRGTGWKKRGSPHTKKQETLHFTFADKESWYAYKNNPGQYLKNVFASHTQHQEQT